jgi:hypothetical protein
MIDLPDHGYVNRKITPVDSGGAVEGSLGGDPDYIERPGYRYSVQYELPYLAMKEARIFESLLRQGSREDVSYPWPLDFRPVVAGAPLVDGSNPPGAVINLKGLTPGCVIRVGQPFAVVLADGAGCIHEATAEAIAGDDGKATVSVFPLTRRTFTNGLVVEIAYPRIRGILSWDGSTQGSFGARPYAFSITERR